jgi:outer membrane translocation and assembly module TamA
LEGSLELRQRIYKIFYLVIFGDAGNVWQLHNQYDFNDLLYAGGLGIRIKTPLGPIRFDAAQPVWNNRKRIQLHISIGQAF